MQAKDYSIALTDILKWSSSYSLLSTTFLTPKFSTGKKYSFEGSKYAFCQKYILSILRHWIFTFVGYSYSSLAFWIDPEISKRFRSSRSWLPRSCSFELALLEQAFISVAMNRKTAKVKQMDLILLTVPVIK